MFGLLVGTLNKAKTEDKARNATDAVRPSFRLLVVLDRSSHTSTDVQAKKRQMIEQRLQDKLKKETDSVRRAEEAKKEKQTANRREEELQLKDSIVCTSLPASDGMILTGGGKYSINYGGYAFRCFPTSFLPQMASSQTARPCPPSLSTH